MWWVSHYWPFWGFGFLLWILVIAALIFFIKWIIQKGRPGEPEQGESALEILKKRYARGEIYRDEFEQKKKDLLT